MASYLTALLPPKLVRPWVSVVSPLGGIQTLICLTGHRGTASVSQNKSCSLKAKTRSCEQTGAEVASHPRDCASVRRLQASSKVVRNHKVH